MWSAYGTRYAVRSVSTLLEILVGTVKEAGLPRRYLLVSTLLEILVASVDPTWEIPICESPFQPFLRF